ncbi:MAG: hypothetical protein IJL83_03375 [Clostridia bacterium]|nr:hypothetical protein [Clostridia bacterium]
MMKNLIKRHLLWDVKLPAYYAAFAAVSVIICRLTDPVTDSAVGLFINRLFFGIAISMAVSTVINMLIRCWVRFTHTSYKDESYLYHTLPLPRAKLYRSHLISSAVAVTVSVIFAALCALLLFINADFIDGVKAAFSTAAGAATAVLIATTLLMEMIFLLFCGIVGTIIGYSFDGSRTLKSVLFAAAIYVCAGLAALPLVYLLGIADPAIKAIFTEGGSPFSTSFWKIGSTLTAYYVALSALLAWIGGKLYLKKINVD